MQNAINLFWYMFNKFLVLIFDDFEILPNVTIGWIIISAFVLSLIMGSILNIPNNIRFNKQYDGHPIKSKKGVNTDG